jgi:hypothetical protein
MNEQMLTPDMTLRETLYELKTFEHPPVSRFKTGSPCRFIRTIDIFVHIIIPELVEKPFPRLARYLRNTSPRWGRSWRHW